MHGEFVFYYILQKSLKLIHFDVILRYHKGVPKLRLEGTSAPNFDRHYGEQIIAFLIINEYLKEDFNYTAYSTISYITKGGRRPGDELLFTGSRVLKLPPIDQIQKQKSSSASSESPAKSPESSASKRKTNKRRISTSDEEEESPKIEKITKSASSSKRFSSSEKSSNAIEKIIVEKVRNSLNQYLKAQDKKEDSNSAEETDDDDCVILSPLKSDVISID